jgi:hypothetical protein
MAYLTLDKVQQWLEPTKATITAIEPALEMTVSDYVLTRIGTQYNIDGWVDLESTPSLVLDAMSMLYAAWFYERQLSEDMAIDTGNWGKHLETWATKFIEDISSGALELIDQDALLTLQGSPEFYPTDNQDSDPNNQRIFTIGSVF